MDNNLLRHTDFYDLIKQDRDVILVDLRTGEKRYLANPNLITIDNMQSDEFDDFALNAFEV